VRAQQVVIAVFSVLMVVVVGFGAIAYLGRSHDPTASVRLLSATGSERWTSDLDSGYAVVVTETSSAVLVAEADDCLGGGPGNVALVTQQKTTILSDTTACRVFRFRTPRPGELHAHIAGGALVVSVPSSLGGGTASLPCPCHDGARAAVTLGKFVPGSD
jgi:hypothetical protein